MAGKWVIAVEDGATTRLLRLGESEVEAARRRLRREADKTRRSVQSLKYCTPYHQGDDTILIVERRGEIRGTLRLLREA